MNKHSSKLTLSELRKKAQPMQYNMNMPDSLWGRIFFRKFSFYISFFLWKLRIKATSVTITFVLLGILSDVLISFPYFKFIFIGFILWFVVILLDVVDGEIARLSEIYSKKGVMIDNISHYVINPGMYWAVGNSIFLITHNKFFIYFSIIGYFVIVIERVIPAMYYEFLGKNVSYDSRRYGMFNAKKSSKTGPYEKGFIESFAHLILEIPGGAIIFSMSLLLSVISNNLSFYIFFYTSLVALNFIADIYLFRRVSAKLEEV